MIQIDHGSFVCDDKIVRTEYVYTQSTSHYELYFKIFLIDNTVLNITSYKWITNICEELHIKIPACSMPQTYTVNKN
jgi:hypothetical protein